MNDLLRGAVAGCAATMPMTTVMGALFRALPEDEQYPQPPWEITLKMAWRAGLWQRLGQGGRLGLTLAAHFGMGTTAGAVYGLVGRRLSLPAAVRGPAFGLAVWAANYLALLPTLGLLSPATEHPPRRTALVIAAHLVWGTALGLVAR